MSITMLEPHKARRLRNAFIEITDGAQGETAGIVRAIAGNGYRLDVQADAFLSRTAVTRKAPPFSGTLGNALRMYLELCGIYNNVIVQPELESVPVNLLGWKANFLSWS